MTSKILTPNFISTHTKTPNYVPIDPSNSFTYISLPNKTDQFHSDHNYNNIHSRHMISSFQQPITNTHDTDTNTNTSSSVSSLCDMWRDIQGSKEWENLLNPLDSLLREEIIRYGEFVNACYKAFDLDPTSRRYLNCKYGKRSMLQQVGLERSGYRVTKYIYATPDVNIPGTTASAAGARWVGYVAVSTDEAAARLGRRDILVAFRGTVTNPEWVSNFMSSLTPARLDPNDARPDVKVESGFLSLYTSDESRHSKFGLQSCREQLLSEISRLLNKYRRNDDHELSVTLSGHSMGSSLALLLGYDILELGLINNHREIPVTVFSFGGPRVGNSGFKNRCDELGLKVLRIVNVNDPITNLPGVVFNEKLQLIIGGGLPWSYSHVGVQLELEFFDVQNPYCVHDLETYITLLRRRPKGGRRRERRKSSSSGDNLFMGMSRDLFSGAHTTQQAIWEIFGTLLPSQMI